MRRRPTDRMLRRWLETGRPRRVERLIETDPGLTERLDALTALASEDVSALTDAVTPEEQFENRVLVGVHERRDGRGAVSIVADLMGLGFHVGRVLMAPPEPLFDEPEPEPEAG